MTIGKRIAAATVLSLSMSFSAQAEEAPKSSMPLRIENLKPCHDNDPIVPKGCEHENRTSAFEKAMNARPKPTTSSVKGVAPLSLDVCKETTTVNGVKIYEGLNKQCVQIITACSAPKGEPEAKIDVNKCREAIGMKP